MRAFLRRLSPATVRARYLSGVDLSGLVLERELARLLDASRPGHMVLVAIAEREVRGIAEYVMESAGRAELAMVVEDRFQGRGIGKALFRSLLARAEAGRIQAFTGDVARDNARVIAMLRGSGRVVRLQPDYGALRFSMRLDEPRSDAA